MNVCKNCGVELDNSMKHCPLCGRSVSDNDQDIDPGAPAINTKSIAPAEKHLLQRITWQVTSILLLSGIAATIIIDVAIHKKITWSVYPISICIILFSYASVLALWHTRIVWKMLAGWVISTVVLVILSRMLENSEWTLRLAIPILFVTNAIGLLLIVIISSAKKKGLNMFAMIIVAIAVYCMALEGLISLYKKGMFQLQWSIIVAACLLPVTAALFFMYFRTRGNADFQKIFHT